MFTGIIEAIGKIESIENENGNAHFTIQSPISHLLKTDQSIAHNGVCLTVTSVNDNTHTVTAIAETLEKTNLRNWNENDNVNLERCMQMNGRLDGHIVQGHVDTTAVCLNVEQKDGSREFTFKIDEKFATLIIEKGSITVNGISLTCFNVTNNTFTVAIIPYTFEHTNIHNVTEGHIVNIEFDIIGKYLQRHLSLVK